MASNVELRYSGEWRRVRKIAQQLNRAKARVGILGAAAASSREEGITQVELAAIHEFGSPKAGIPERSFIRRTFAENERKMARIMAVLAMQLVEGKTNVVRALGQLGAIGAAEVKNRITKGEGIPPPLKPETVQRKKSSRPLVDSGRLLGAITWDVEGA